MRTVRHRAGVSTATAYTYFASKNHLFAELFWRLLAEDDAADPGATAARAAAARDPRTSPTLLEGAPELAAAATPALLGSDPDVERLRLRIGGEFVDRFRGRPRRGRRPGAARDAGAGVLRRAAAGRDGADDVRRDGRAARGRRRRDHEGERMTTSRPSRWCSTRTTTRSRRTPTRSTPGCATRSRCTTTRSSTSGRSPGTPTSPRPSAPRASTPTRWASRSSSRAWGPDAHKVMSILGMDPPRQNRLRSLVSRGFTPRRVHELRRGSRP